MMNKLLRFTEIDCSVRGAVKNTVSLSHSYVHLRTVSGTEVYDMTLPNVIDWLNALPKIADAEVQA